MNIMIVDDEIATLEILSASIDWSLLGIQQVFTARNAMEAKALLAKDSIAITVCDIEMPRESGLELISWIKDLYPEIVNIILTGHQDFNYARDAVSLGVYAYLLKPILFAELEATVKAAIEKIHSEQTPECRKKKEQLYSIDTEKELSLKGYLAEIRNYINSHYGEDITRANIESLVHLNVDHVNREFKRETGFSLMEYTQYYRIYMGKKMLSENKLSIGEIGSLCGYNSQSYFSEVFKKCTGMTPNEYRKNNTAHISQPDSNH